MSQIHEPDTLEEAVSLLAELSDDASALAGGTWVMRESRRHAHYVSLRRLGALRAIEVLPDAIRIGALATHDEIGRLDATAPLDALVDAARRSAFPAVRNVATLGGNLAAPFSQADLLPPLLAAGATLELARLDGPRTVAIDDFERPVEGLLVAARVPTPPGRRSGFERLTVRGGAEYSVVSVAVSVDTDADETITAARVAVGAVQDEPVRAPAAEQALVGRRLGDAGLGAEAGRAAAAALTARDDLDAPGWYRLEVLPALVDRVMTRLRGRR